MLTKNHILTSVARRTTVLASPVFGGDIHMQELLRSAWRDASRAADLGNDLIDLDVWHAHLFAALVVDADGTPMFTAADVLAWPKRDAVWSEIRRVANEGLALSEVGPEAVKSGDSAADAG